MTWQLIVTLHRRHGDEAFTLNYQNKAYAEMDILVRGMIALHLAKRGVRAVTATATGQAANALMRISVCEYK